ncbi:TetR/AcrR family transcriptional regulator C-terminal domain-containing protein [Blautia sp. Sow4_E7]|uniref:TetR/AcrR family transcriptional regulator C-terminal domain-containing protein n=1 Tax=Blautia sp. Sow4_E7 TaxID=3438749 RepID=UPI003F93F25B
MEINNQKSVKGEKTKYKLAHSMKECMLTTSVENITVKQIVENCGLTRQTFYRNFLDKYDLINWYFDKLLLKSFEHMGRGKTVYDALVKKFTYIQEEQAFFAAAFRYDNQNSLRQHDFELILDFYENLIRENTGRSLDEDTHFLLEMYCQSSIFMTIKWVLGEMECTPEKLAQILVMGMPGTLEKLFTESGILN